MKISLVLKLNWIWFCSLMCMCNWQRLWKSLSLFLRIDHLNAVTGGKQFEFLHRDCFFSSEVPSNKIFKFAFLEIEATTFYQILELTDIDFLSVLVLNAIKEAFQELVVLLLIREFICVISIKGAHELAKFIFIDMIRSTIDSIVTQIGDKWVIESLLGSLVIRRVDGTR